jgi:RimJ/RimL family protein N-acetyltransferase
MPPSVGFQGRQLGDETERPEVCGLCDPVRMNSSRTLLRSVRREDAVALFQAVYAGEDPDPRSFLSSGPTPSTPEEMRQQIDDWIEGEADGRGRAFVIVDGDDEVIGFALLTREDKVVEPALMVGPRFRKDRHAKRAMAELKRLAREDGAEEMEAVVNVANVPVTKILDPHGFQRVGHVHPKKQQQTWGKPLRTL